MKHTIIATSFALVLACASSVSSAQQQPAAANLRGVNVTVAAGQYEIYQVDLNTGYGLKVRVGSTRRQYMEAQRETDSLEAMRKQGMAQSPFVDVAIDNSLGQGTARRILLSDRAQTTVAIVDVYCKHAASYGGRRCLLVPQPVSTHASSQQLASTPVGSVSLAQIQIDQVH